MKEAYYFPHDANARTDAKILELRAELGWEGYGLWWALVEQLREAADYRLSNDRVGGLAMGLGIAKKQLETLLALCYDLGLLEMEGGYFFAPALRRRMEPWDAKRAALSDAGKRGAGKRWAADKPADGPADTTPIPPECPGYSQAIATPLAGPIAIKEKERKGKKRESNDSPREAPATAPSPVSASPVLAKTPDAPRPARAVSPDEAPVFTTKGFREFVKGIGFGGVDIGYYLPLVQRAAEKTGEQRPAAGLGKTWEDFVEWYFRNERKFNRVVYPLDPATPDGPNPALQLVTKTDYSPEAIAARNIVKY